MASPDSAAILALRAGACILGGVTAGLLLAGPALAVPALFASPHLTPRARLHVWSRLHTDTTTATSRLLPLLAALLACCALLVSSAPGTARSSPIKQFAWLAPLPTLVAENRRTLFIIAASFIIALRPYSFGLLTPRIEVLRAEDRRILVARLRSTAGRGANTWRGASPTKEYGEWVAEREREAEESDVEDNDVVGAEGAEDGDPAVRVVPLDTDSLILDLTRLQFGTAVLAGISFALTVLELLCA